jgi:hypothetical protein
MENTNFSTPEKIQVIERIVQVQQPMTIERTAKQYKFGMLVGFLLMALGILASMYSVYKFTQNYERYPISFTELAEDQKSIYVALSGIVGGFVVYRFEKFLAWWNHG